MAADTTKVPDPLTASSMAGHVLFWSALLILSTFWAVWDEAWGKRPWKGYQAEFLRAYDEVLVQHHEIQQQREAEARANPEYKAIETRLREATTNAARDVAEIDRKTILIARQIEALNRVSMFPKGEIGALQYRIDKAEGRAKESLKAAMRYVTSERKYTVDIPNEAGKERKELTYQELTKLTDDLKAERIRLGQQRAKLDAEPGHLRKELAHWLSMNMKGVAPDQITGLRYALDAFVTEVKQVHVADVGLIDRCTTCHLGAVEPVPITRPMLAEAGVDDEMMQTMFASHPRPDTVSGKPDLLAIHPPERFGCSPCHGGNGTGTINTKLAHGLNKHWLWKLYERANFEAGCQQCHEGSIVLPGATTLNHGRELFRLRGCWACHKREGFNRETDELQAIDTSLRANRATLDQKLREEKELNELAAKDTTPADEVPRIFGRLDAIKVEKSQLQTELDELHLRQRNLNFERKRQGPNLKEIKAKLKKEWLPDWLRNARGFRPTTKMPQFRLAEHQVQAIAAFLWQDALDVNSLGIKLEAQPKGDAAKGKTLFEQRGCMGCHAVDGKGNDWAAELSRLGEKANYDYIVRWIHDPAQRLLPYSPQAGRDITPDDYKSKGKEPVWGRYDTECPLTGGEMIVENQAVMPTMRLTWEESRDVATYLIGLKTDKEYPATPFVDDASLFEKGRIYVRHFGCAGCHEIGGLENEGPIGTELTKEGSKPIERLDFGLLTFDYKRSGRYRHKDFFMDKLKQPEIFDTGKERGELEVLRMPNFGLTDPDRVALTTFLLGSVDSQYPARFYHQPTGHAKDIRDGWWVVNKYNCTGCHEIVAGEKPVLQKLEWFAAPDNIKNAPPSLVGQGFRTNPIWLAKFLRNPVLDDPKKAHGNGVREYLQVRMPTFRLTENEVQILVRFFAALSRQPLPPVEEALRPMSQQAATAARMAFEKEVCLKCHVTDGPLTPDVIAPSFLLSGERLSAGWMRRWLLDPGQLIPGTQMPSGLFRQETPGGRWVFRGNPNDWPAELRAWPGDHVELLIDYMRQYHLVNPPKR